ncbi:hypothetical protein MTO96_009469 [Rhipicephalus appendiculatus]
MHVLKYRQRLRRCLLTAVIYCSTLASTAQLHSTAFNDLLAYMAKEYPEYHVLGSFTFTFYSLPTILLCSLYLWCCLLRRMRPERAKIRPEERRLPPGVFENRLTLHGPWNFRELSTLAVAVMVLFVSAIPKTAWTSVFTRSQVTPRNLAPVLPWTAARTRFPWTCIALTACGQVHVAFFQRSGMNDVLVSWVKYISGKTSQAFLPLLGILSTLTAELTSKDKGVSFLLPTLDAIIRAQKVNPLTLMLPATRLASATFSISTSSQNNALLRDCGGLSALDMITIGGQLHVVFAALELLSVLTVGDAMFSLDSFPAHPSSHWSTCSRYGLQQTDGDKLIREINSKLVDNIMLGIEEITGHRGGNYWKQVMEQIDEKYLKPLLQHKSAQDSLTRVYTKVVLADHYAHLYGPAAALEENIPLNIQQSFDEGMLDALTEERIEEEAVADEEEENAEDEDRGLLFHANTDRKPSIAPVQNQIGAVPPRRVRFSRFADQVRAASQSAEGGTAEKRRHTVGAMFSRSFHQDSVEAEDPTKLLVKALNENPYHKYHQRYNPNLVGDEHQELEAHLRARRRRAHRLTLATMASEMSSAEMSVEGSRGNLAPPSPGATVLSPVTVGPTTPIGGGDVAATVAAAAALSAGVEQLADGRPLTAAQFRRASTTLQKSAYTWLSLAHRRHSMMRLNKAGSMDGRSLRSSLKLERQSAVTEDVSDDNAEHAKSESSSTQAHSREGSQSLQLSLAQQPSDVHEPGAEPASASEDSKSPEEKTKETSF